MANVGVDQHVVVLPGDNVTELLAQSLSSSSLASSSSRSNDNKNKNKKQNTSGNNNNDSSKSTGAQHWKLGTGLCHVRLDAPTTEDDKTQKKTKKKKKNEESTPTTATATAKDVQITATLAGRIHYRPSTRTHHVRINQRRYYAPRVDDRIVGVVEEVVSGGGGGSVGGGGGDSYYRINMLGPRTGLLHCLAFAGATKRNRPHLQRGSLLYCRIDQVPTDMDPILSCVPRGTSGSGDGGASTSDWMTDSSTFGELKGGVSFRVSSGLAWELLRPHSLVLQCLGGGFAMTTTSSDYDSTQPNTIKEQGGEEEEEDDDDKEEEEEDDDDDEMKEQDDEETPKKRKKRKKKKKKKHHPAEAAHGIPFEICIGMNGMIWIHSHHPLDTILLVNAIRKSEVLTPPQVQEMCRTLLMQRNQQDAK